MGLITDLEGREFDWKSPDIVASNGLIHQSMLEVIRLSGKMIKVPADDYGPIILEDGTQRFFYILVCLFCCGYLPFLILLSGDKNTDSGLPIKQVDGASLGWLGGYRLDGNRRRKI